MMQRKNTSAVLRAELFLTYFQNQQGAASFVCEISKKIKLLRNLGLCTVFECIILERCLQSFNLASRK